uniref:dipeptidase E n=1 Tax=Scylla olivacea TaxID=85551 RepID=A0A0P4W6A0_SCYOL
MAARNLLLLSNSTVHGSGYLDWAAEYVKEFLKSKSIQSVVFVPYALRDMDSYAEKAIKKFSAWGFEMSSVHHAADPTAAVRGAEAIFVGGGNTFQLLKSLYDNKLIEPIRKKVLEEGAPYIGSSAGTNIATVSICTTNDMPIVHPPSFTALSLVPFNINPHYIDANPATTHMGETREERIMQYHELPSVPPVLALREGSLLKVEGDVAVVKGLYPARLFVREKQPEEFPVNSDLSFLLKQ